MLFWTDIVTLFFFCSSLVFYFYMWKEVVGLRSEVELVREFMRDTRTNLRMAEKHLDEINCFLKERRVELVLSKDKSSRGVAKKKGFEI